MRPAKNGRQTDGEETQEKTPTQRNPLEQVTGRTGSPQSQPSAISLRPRSLPLNHRMEPN